MKRRRNNRVRSEELLEVGFAEHDHMIQQFASTDPTSRST